MKIRNGFVSNSSSSSFIVAFPEHPKSLNHLKNMMFGGRDSIKCYDTVRFTEDIAKAVYAEIESGKSKPINFYKAVDVLLEGYFPGYPPYKYKENKPSDLFEQEYLERTGKSVLREDADPVVKKEYHRLWNLECKQSNEIVKIAAGAYMKAFWPLVKGKKVYKFEFSDDHGGINLELGDIFRNLQHVCVSKH